MCEPSDPKSLWDKYKDVLFEDILREAQRLCPTMALTFNDEIYNRALIIIENVFVEMRGGSLAAIGLPTPDRVASSSLSPEIVRETFYSVEELNAYVTTNEPKLLIDQRAAYDAVLASTTEVLRRCKLIVNPKTALEALNRSLKDIRNSDDLMGGITVLLSGDFRQTLPKGTRADAIRACLKSSQLWPTVRPLHLTTNMRAHLTRDVGSAEFSNSLLALGEGIIPADTNGFVNVQGLSTVVTTPATLRENQFFLIFKPTTTILSGLLGGKFLPLKTPL
ncbi:unnamed protein product [Acanthosepion pharaonis]|uniref:ATP-dependent DNA helicase n=1 Tax=Acanthosepion pharaonis TaxID=158019 RepID=A0A812BD01_ACAPH|nr:unnamed protein product [Sepia pharaonis]